MAISFREFVISQPTDRTINHDGGWSSCAVGDYQREELGNEDILVPVRDIIDNDELYNCLNENGYDYRAERVIHTYGDIQDYYNGKLKLTA